MHSRYGDDMMKSITIITVTSLLLLALINDSCNGQETSLKEDDEAAIIDSPIYSTDYEEIKNDDLLLVSQDEEVSTDGKITSFEGSGEEPPPILLNRFAGVTECEIKDDTVSCQGKMLNRIPDTVLSTVTTLNLNDNSFTKLSSDLFSQKLNNVKQINLANNQINSIESSFFEFVPYLERLNLSDNALVEFDPEVFSKASFLSELLLSGNPIKIDDRNPLLHSSSLKILELQRCNLESIPENTFDGVSSLEELDLGGNTINASTPISVDVFVALTNLSGLVLPENSSEELVIEVCKKHGLLPAICMDSCEQLLIPCGEAETTSDTYYTDDSIYDEETTTATAAEDEASEMLKPPRRSGTRNRTRENMISEDTVPESSRSGVSGAEVDHTIITLIVAAVIVAVLVVVVKKNWSKIRAKFGREQQIIEPIPLNQQQKQIRPEEVPLQNKNTV